MSEDKREPHELTMKEQLKGLLEDNINKYPDAIRWIRERIELTNLNELYTEYEKFMGALDGTLENNEFWADCPYKVEYGNKVDMIKWYRHKTGEGLKVSKQACDAYLLEKYGHCSPHQELGYDARNGFWNP